jgi:hypothetical protein
VLGLVDSEIDMLRTRLEPHGDARRGVRRIHKLGFAERPNARDVEVRNPERGAWPSWSSAALIDRDSEARNVGMGNHLGGQARGRRLAEARAKVDACDP